MTASFDQKSDTLSVGLKSAGAVMRRRKSRQSEFRRDEGGDAARYDRVVTMDKMGNGVYYFRIVVVGENGERFVSIKKMMVVNSAGKALSRLFTSDG